MKKPAWNHHRTPRRLGLFEPLEQRMLLAGDITTGLVHYWTFDETSGDTAHDSVGGSDGMLMNWSPTEPKWEPGRVGGALHFSTADDAVVATPPAMSGSYAVSFWLNVTDRSGTNPRIFQSRAGNDIIVNNDSSRSVGYYYSGTSIATSDPSVPTFNTWEHYAINFNVAGQGVVYHNGAPVAVGGFVDSVSLASWVFGHSSNLANTTDSLNGLLDDLRVYNRLLTDDDIALLASQGTPEATHQGPVHHWTFDETTGYTAHDIAGDANGILVNWNASEPRWEPGKVGGALAFTTDDDMVVTPPVSTHAQWSVAFWVNVMAHTGTNPRVLEPWAYIRFDNHQGMGFSYGNADTFDDGQVQLGKWEHYAITFDTLLGKGTIYRNGVAVKSGFFGGNAPAFQLVFGHNHDLSNPNDSLHGLLDDLRIYDRVLSPSEIQQLSSTASPPPPPQGLINHWTFDETTGDTAHDSVGGNDGTLQNWGAAENKWVPGHIGGAVSFSDANDLILTNSPINHNQYTIAFWLETTGPGGTNPRIAAPMGTLYDWVLVNREINKGVGFYYRGSTAFGPTAPVQGTWEHYAVVADQAAGTAKIYRNGTLVTTGTFNDVPALQQWVFGHNSDVTNHTDSLAGLLDDLRIYDRLLTAGEVQRLATGQTLVAADDDYSTNEDVALNVNAAQGVLANDSDLDGQPMAIVDVGPLHGGLALNNDGSFTYTPAHDYNGADSFTYRLTDSQGNSVVATVSLTVKPVNDAPSFTIGVDQFVISDEMPKVFRATNDPVPSETLPEWATNLVSGPPTASDEVGQTLALTVTNDNASLFVDQPAIDYKGTLTFTPAPNVSGMAVVTVTLKDSGGTADGGVDTSVRTFDITITKPHPWHNVANGLDVTHDGHIAPVDALTIINYLNAFGSQPVPQNASIGPLFLDATGDNTVAPDDVLAIINSINAGGGGSASIPGSASFVGVDATTQGNWKTLYGTDGYVLDSGSTSLPPYADVTFTGGLTDLYDVIDAASTNDPRALQKPDSTDRIAAYYTGDYGFTLDINIHDGQTHQVALYMLDGGRNGRSQRLDVIDAATGQVLDTQTVDDFGDGKYLVWNLSGHVQIRFTNLANGLNAVASGVFFG